MNIKKLNIEFLFKYRVFGELFMYFIREL
jgi:hypothetical protein